MLPVAPAAAVPPLAFGWTPLQAYPRLAAHYGIKQLLFKDEGRNPTASLKDRPSALAVVLASKAGAQVLTVASSGNAGSALAGMCASVGLKSGIFVEPAAASFAGFIKRCAAGQIKAYESVLLVLTGHDLKDVTATAHVRPEPLRILPNLTDLMNAVSAQPRRLA